MRTLLSLAAVLIGTLYVLNLGAGLFEVLPDALPVVGHLDEAAATALLIAGLRGLRRRDATASAPARPGAGGGTR